jgi:hypothetical protein
MNQRRLPGRLSFRLEAKSESDPLNFVLCQSLLRAVVELRRARAFMRGHGLGMLERAAIREIRCDAGCPKRVIADRCQNSPP